MDVHQYVNLKKDGHVQVLYVQLHVEILQLVNRLKNVMMAIYLRMMAATQPVTLSSVVTVSFRPMKSVMTVTETESLSAQQVVFESLSLEFKTNFEQVPSSQQLEV